MIIFLGQKLKFLLIFILVVVGISFVFFGDWSGHGGSGLVIPAKIQGRNITVPELQQAIRAERLIYTVSSGQLPPSGSEADRNFASRGWNRLLILNEAQKSGFTVPASKLETFIRTNPIFQKPGTQEYSPEQFARFKQFVLDPQGITPDRFLEIIRDQFIYEFWVGALESTAVVLPDETEKAFQSLFGKASLEYIAIPAASVTASIPVNDEVLRGYYDKRPERFQLPEQRKVDVVFFRLPANADKLSEEERTKLRRSLGEKAYQFTEPFYAAAEAGQPLPDFNEAVKAAGLTVETSPYIARGGSVPGTTGGTALAGVAFTLDENRSLSDYIAIPEGFAVLRLREIQPPTLRPFDAVKAEVRKAYLETETNLRLQAAGENLVIRLRKELAEGKSWPQAVAASGARSISIPPFVPASGPDAKMAVSDLARLLSTQLEPGKISDPLPQGDTVYIFHLAARAEPEASVRSEMLPRVQEQLLQQRRLQIREEWLTSLSSAPGTVVPRELLGLDLN
jgi:hypothetical protein